MDGLGILRQIFRRVIALSVSQLFDTGLDRNRKNRQNNYESLYF